MVNIDYLYNPDAAKNAFEKNYFIDKELGFSVIENGTILPHKSIVIPGKWHFGLGGIVDNKGEYILESSVHFGNGGAYTPPHRKFSIVTKPSSISECFFPCGVTILPTTFAAFGF